MSTSRTNYNNNVNTNGTAVTTTTRPDFDTMAHQAANGFLDTSQLVNLTIGGYSMNLLTELKSEKSRWKIIMIFLVLISLNDIKGILSDVLQSSRNELPKLIMKMLRVFLDSLKAIKNFRPNPNLLLSMAKSIIPTFKRPRVLKSPKFIMPARDLTVVSPPTPRVKTIEVELTPNVFLVNALHRFCQNNKFGGHRPKFTLNLKSNTALMNTLEYTNIDLHISDPNHHTELEARMTDQLQVEFDHEGDVKAYKINGLSHDEIIRARELVTKVDNSKKEVFEQKTDVLDLETYPWVVNCQKMFKKDLIATLNKYSEFKLGPEIHELIKFTNNKILVSDYQKMPTYQAILPDKQLDFTKALLSYQTELKAAYEQNDYNLENKTDLNEYRILVCLSIVLKDASPRGEGLTIIKEGEGLYIYFHDEVVSHRRMPYTLKKYEYSVKDNKRVKYTFAENCDPSRFFNGQTFSVPSELALKFSLTGPSYLKAREMYDHFSNYVQREILASTAKKDADLIVVYSIRFTKSERTIETKNPLFDDWENQIDMLKRLLEASAQAPALPPTTPSNEEGENGLKEVPPPPRPAVVLTPDHPVVIKLVDLYDKKPERMLKRIEFDYNLECKAINKIYKKLETLYIREMDKMVLTNMLDKFKNKRTLYMDLGIPYKLGMLFHGLPGTGKTSAIKAVASYLGKNIFFVHLKHIKTNKDLKTVFEHINDKCNGGIIVLEDIDAATDVVYRRTATSTIPSTGAVVTGSDQDNMEAPKSFTDCLEDVDDQLTLSYLLNLLDGTLCNDGTIFAITTNHIEKLDPALYRKGRVDVTIEFKLCDHFQIQEIFQTILGRPLNRQILDRIPEDKYPPCEVIFHVYQYLLNSLVSDEMIMRPFMEA